MRVLVVLEDQTVVIINGTRTSVLTFSPPTPIQLQIYNIPKELIIQKVIDKLKSSFTDIKINEYNDNLCKYFSIAW